MSMSKAAMWCKSKVGREHTPQVSKEGRVLGTLGTCKQQGSKWMCAHHVRCEVCGRVLTYEWQMDPADCPENKAATVDFSTRGDGLHG